MTDRLREIEHECAKLRLKREVEPEARVISTKKYLDDMRYLRTRLQEAEALLEELAEDWDITPSVECDCELCRIAAYMEKYGR